MKTHYKYIHFGEDQSDGGCACFNNRSNKKLGDLDYYEQWKQWVFMPEMNTVYNVECLLDIADFLKQLNEGGA